MVKIDFSYIAGKSSITANKKGRNPSIATFS